MPPTLRCAGCHTALRMRPEYVGKKIRCPRCLATRSVPTIQPDDPPLLPLEADSPPPDPNDPTIDGEHPSNLPPAEQDSDDPSDGDNSFCDLECSAADSFRAGRLNFLLTTALLAILLLLLIGTLVWIFLN